jgi:probable rRNA maturation factor
MLSAVSLAKQTMNASRSSAKSHNSRLSGYFCRKDTTTLSIVNETKGSLSRELITTSNALLLAKIKNAILGKKYELSIAYLNPAKAKKLNANYRGKDYATDVLSFPLSKKSGEIVLCPPIIKKKAVEFGMTTEKYNKFIVIHGMLHLKGYAHGSRMEQAEKLFLRRFS